MADKKRRVTTNPHNRKNEGTQGGNTASSSATTQKPSAAGMWSQYVQSTTPSTTQATTQPKQISYGSPSGGLTMRERQAYNQRTNNFLSKVSYDKSNAPTLFNRYYARNASPAGTSNQYHPLSTFDPTKPETPTGIPVNPDLPTSMRWSVEDNTLMGSSPLKPYTQEDYLKDLQSSGVLGRMAAPKVKGYYDDFLVPVTPDNVQDVSDTRLRTAGKQAKESYGQFQDNYTNRTDPGDIFQSAMRGKLDNGDVFTDDEVGRMAELNGYESPAQRQKNIDDYNYAVQVVTDRDPVRNYGQSRVDGANATIERLQSVIDGYGDATPDDYMAALRPIADDWARKGSTALQEQKAYLDWQTKLYKTEQGRREKYDRDTVGDYRDRPDFGEKGVSTLSPAEDMFYKVYDVNGGVESTTGFIDPAKLEQAGIPAEYAAVNGYQVGNPEYGVDLGQGNYAALTDEERSTYNYICATEGYDAGKAWLDSVNDVLNYRQTVYANKENEQIGYENPLLGGAVSVGTNLINGMMTPIQLIDALDGKVDPYSGLYAAGNATTSLRKGGTKGASEWWSAPLPWDSSNTWGSFLYSSALSMADKLAAAGVGNALGGTNSKISQWIVQGIMSSEAGSSKFIEEVQQGDGSQASVYNALLSGVIDGLVEAGTEKWSVEALFADPTNFLQYMLKTTFSEGAEEFTGDSINLMVGKLRGGAYDEINNSAYSIMSANPGMDIETAKSEAVKQWFASTLTDTLAGSLSGGVMGGAYGGPQSLATHFANVDTGKTIANNGTVDAIRSIAESMPTTSASYKLAQSITRKDGTVNLAKTGALVQTLSAELDQQGANVVQKAFSDTVATRLQELGETGDVQAIGAVIAKQAQGEKLTRSEKAMVKNSTYAQRVANELNDNGDSYSSGWTDSIRSNQLNAIADNISNQGKLMEALTVQQSKNLQASATQAADMVEQSETPKTIGKMMVEADNEKSKNMGVISQTANGTVAGDVVGVASVGDDGVMLNVKSADGTVTQVAADDVKVQSFNTAQLISYASKTGMSATEASLMLNSYQGGMPARTFIAQFEGAYNAGLDGVAFDSYKRGIASGVDSSVLKIAYDTAVSERKDNDAKSRAARTEKNRTAQKGKISYAPGTQSDISAMTKSQRNQVQLAGMISEVTGINITFFESKVKDGRYVGMNGMFDPETNSIMLDLNAGRNFAGQADVAIMRTLSHELTHFIQANAKEQYTALRDFVVQTLTDQGRDVSELVQEKIDRAQQSGHKLNRAGAMDEVIADGCEMMLRDSKTIAKLATDNQTLSQKIKSFVKEFIGRMRKAFEGISPDQREAAWLMDAKDSVDQLQRLWDVGLEEAVKNGRETQESTEPESSMGSDIVQHLDRESDDPEIAHIKDQIKSNLDELNAMPPVSDAKTPDVSKMKKVDIQQWTLAMFKEHGYVADRKEFGKILVGKKQLFKGLKYLESQGEYAAFASLYHVLKRGRIIEKHINHKTRKINTATIAAPVIINGTRGVMAAVVKFDTDYRYKVHRILMPDGSAFVLKQNAEPTLDTRTPSSGELVSPISSATNSIPDSGENSNNFSEKNIQATAIESSDIHTAYSLREKEPPKKTVIGYKAFYARDGKLYPPMVSNITESDGKTKVSKATSGTMKSIETPVGVWLDADVGGIMVDEHGEPVRTTDTKRLRVKNDKSGGGATLAFRPGWHLGEWPDAKQFNKKDANGNRTLMPDDLVFAKCEVSADVDYQLDALSYGINAKGNLIRSQAGLPRVPVDGMYKYRTNVDPTTAPWIIAGSMRVLEVLSDEECARICAEHNVEPSQRYSGHPIRLSDFGLKKGTVTATEDLTRFTKNDASRANDTLLERALSDGRYADAYVPRSINFDDPALANEFSMNGQDIEEYRKMYEEKGKRSDREYTEAVKAGDMAKAQKMVDEAAEAAFPDSKARDENGKLKRFFHGTNSGDFHVFDKRYIGSGSGDSGFFGRGYYFAFTKSEAKFYGSKVLSSYLNTKNPFMFQETLLTYDGNRPFDSDATDAVFVVNMAKQFPDLVKDQKITAYTQDGEQKILSYAEFAKEYEKLYKELKFRVDEVNGYNGKEYVARAGKRTYQYDAGNGKTESYVGYDYEQRAVDKKWAESQADNTFAYISNVLYSSLFLDSSSKAIMDMDGFSDAVQAAGYDSIFQSAEGDEAVLFDSSQIKLSDPVTYDDKGEVVPLSERFNEGKSDIRYSFAGERAATAVHAQLDHAKELNSKGKSAKEIWEETFWYRGTDGQWRFEIDDSKAKMIPLDIGDKRVRLGEVLDHPALYEAYPFLKDIPFSVDENLTYGADGETDGGSYITLNKGKFTGMSDAQKARLEKVYDSKAYKDYRAAYNDAMNNTDRLTNNEWKNKITSIQNAWESSRTGKQYKALIAERNTKQNQIKTSDDTKSVILHEIQHIIQREENFMRGSNPGIWRSILQNGIVLMPNSKKIDLLRTQERALWDSVTDELRTLENRRFTLRDAINGIEWGETGKLLDMMAEIDELNDKISELDKNGTVAAYDEVIEQKRQMQKENVPLDAMGAYFHTGGEMEARDVQERMNMTEEERRGKMPKVDPDALDMWEYQGKFSMREPVEVTKDLVAVHNLKDSDLRGILELNGFPVPSIAVIKAKQGHSMYGDISVVFGRDTIDPEKSSYNRVYGADAYTSTFPTVEYRVNDKAIRKAYTRLTGLVDGTAGHYGHSIGSLMEFRYDESTGKSMDELVERARGNEGMMAAYMADKGTPVETITAKTEAEPDGWNPKATSRYDTFINILGNDFERAGQMPYTEMFKKYGDEIVAAFPWAEGFRDGKATFRDKAVMGNLIRGAQKYSQNAMTEAKTYTDYNAMNSKMEESIDREDFTKWIRKELNGILGGKGIRNDKDPYTTSGNSRSFAQLHDAYTLQGIVDAMRRTPEKNAGGEFNMLAAASRKYKSIDEIKADSGRLGKVDQETYDAQVKALNDRIEAVASGVKNIKGWTDSYDMWTEAQSLLAEAAGKNWTASRMVEAFRKEGIALTMAQANEARSVFAELRTVPTGYFEAKPARAVGLDEVKAVIVPDTLDSQLVAEMQEKGLNVVPYEAGNEQARTDALNGLEDVKFSDRERNAYPNRELRLQDYEDNITKSDLARCIDMFWRNDKYNRKMRVGDFNYFNLIENGGYSKYIIYQKTNSDYFDVKGIVVETEKVSQEQAIENLNYLMSKLKGIYKYVDREIQTWSSHFGFYAESPLRRADDRRGGSVTYDPSEQRGGSERDYQDVRGWRAGTRSDGLDTEGTGENSELSRYSDRVYENLTDRDLLAGVTVDESLTLEAQTQLKAYKTAYKEMERASTDLATAREQERNGSTTEEKLKWRNRADILRKRVDRLEKSVQDVEKHGELKALATEARKNFDKYVKGKSEAELANAMGTMKRTLRTLQARKRMADARFDMGDLDALTRELCRSYGFSVSAKDMSGKLLDLFTAMKNDKDGSQDATGAFGKYINDLVRKATVKDTNGTEMLGEVSGYFRKSKIGLSDAQWAEVEHVFGSRKAFRDRVMGRWNIVAAGTPGATTLDMVWNELTDMFPGTFDKNTTANDEPMAIADFFDSSKAKDVPAYTGEDAATVFSDVFDALFGWYTGINKADANWAAIEALKNDLRSANGQLTAQAKTHTQEIQELRHEHFAEMKDERAKRKAAQYELEMKKAESERLNKEIRKVQRQLDTVSSRAARDVARLHDTYQKRMENQRENAKQTETKNKLRRQIKRGVKRLNDLMVNETDYRHVPEAFKPAVRGLVEAFTGEGGRYVFDKKTAERLQRVYSIYSRLDGDVSEGLEALAGFYDPDIEYELRELMDRISQNTMLSHGNTGLSMLERKNLEISNLEYIKDVVDHFAHITRVENESFLGGRKTTFSEIGAATRDELNAREDHRQLAGKLGSFTNTADTFIRTGNITPMYFFKHLGGRLQEMFNDIRRGQNTFGLRMDESNGRIQSMKQQYNYDVWASVKGDELKLTTEQKHDVTFTREQAMWVYATHKRELANDLQGAEHLTRGGFVYDSALVRDGEKGITVRTQTRPNVLSDKDIATITSWLTDEQRAYADSMVGYLSGDMADIGNQVSMDMYGIKKYKEQYYFPYSSARNLMYSKSVDASSSMTDDNRVKHQSFTHRTVAGAGNALVMGDFTDVAVNHIQQMITYGSMCEPIENMNRVLNWSYDDEGSRMTIKALLEQKMGRNTINYIAQLMQDLNAGTRIDFRDKLVGRMVSKFKKNAVFASLSVAVQQPSAIMRATAMIDPKYIGKSAFRWRDYEELKRYSGVAVIKQMGRFGMDMGAQNAEWLSERETRMRDLFTKDGLKGFFSISDSKMRDDILGMLPGKMDEITWSHLWNAVKLEQAAAHRGMDTKSEEFLQMCGERFNEVADYTQVYDSTLSRSQNMRSNTSLMQMVTSFMAEPTVTINMLYDSLRHTGKHGANVKGRINPARALAALTANALLNAILQSLITTGRDDDDDRTYLEKYLTNIAVNFVGAINPFEQIPWVQDIWQLYSGWDVERADMTLFSDLKDAIDKMSSKNLSNYRKIENLAGAIAAFAGLPVKNVMRDLRTAYNTMTSDFSMPQDWSSLKFDALQEVFGGVGYKDNDQTSYAALYAAAVKGDSKDWDSAYEHATGYVGLTDKKIIKAMKDRIHEDYLAGKLDDDTAIKLLTEQGGMVTKKGDPDEDSAYYQLKKWKDKEEYDSDPENEDSDEDYSFSRYDEVYDAVKSGTGYKEAVADMVAHGYTEKDVKSKVKTQVGAWYQSGEMDKATATKALKTYCGVTDSDELYWGFKEWDYIAENGSNEGYSDYGSLYTAISTGSGLAAAVKELTDHGKTKSRISSAITGKYKDEYIRLVSSGQKSKAATLLSYILDALEKAGYNRSKENKSILRNWK